MARDHARILVAIWRDEKFLALSPRAQRMYLLLLSQPRLSFCGLLDYTPGRWANLGGGDAEEDVCADLDELALARFVVIDDRAQELLIRSFVRHDGVCDSPNLIQAMWKAWDGIHSDMLRHAVVCELPDKAFVTGFGSAKKDYEPPREAIELRQNKPSPKGSSNGSVEGSGNGSPTPTPSPTPSPAAKTIVEQAEPTALALVQAANVPAQIDSVVVVFDAWREATGKHKAQLDPSRRTVIRKALERYPLEDVLDAVRGWRRSPFHCGKNNGRKVYNDLGLLLRNADKIEGFRDMERVPPGSAIPKRLLDLVAWSSEETA